MIILAIERIVLFLERLVSTWMSIIPNYKRFVALFSPPLTASCFPVTAADPLIRWDSYENFREGESPMPQNDGRGSAVEDTPVGYRVDGHDPGRQSATSSTSTTSPPPPPHSRSTPCSSSSSPPLPRRSPSPFSSTSPLPIVAELQEEKGKGGKESDWPFCS